MDRRTDRQRMSACKRIMVGVSTMALLLSLAPKASAQLLTTPTPVTPSDNQYSAVVDASCVQQLDDLILGLNISATAEDGLGLAGEAAAQLVPPPGDQAGEGLALIAQIAAWSTETAIFAMQEQMAEADYPDCDATFAGTVQVTAGGLDITGNSIFQNGLGVVQDMEVGGNAQVDGFLTAGNGFEANGLSTFIGEVRVFGDQTIDGALTVTGPADFQSSLTAQSLVSQTGVSAYDGAIWLGQPNNTGFDAGISLGGGALSGAGTGGVAALATHQNAMALGNSAFADQSGAVAVGSNASSSALDAVSFGANASATAQAAIASGAGASASGAGAAAYGQLAFASAAGAVAVGQNASATGLNSIAIGAGASATGSVAVGAGASAANGGAAFGDNATALGFNSTALGPGATAPAANSVAIGSGSLANQANTVSIGAAGAERRLVNLADGVDPFDGVNRRQLDDAVERLERGVASTLAQTAPMLPLDRGQTGFAVGAGYYRGETGLGVRMEHRFDTAADMLVSVGLATAGGSDSTTGQAGFSFRF